MSDQETSTRDPESVLPGLEELCRSHDVGLDLIAHGGDVDELLGRVLDELETRLAGIADAGSVRALVQFAAQAAELRERARQLERQAERMNTLAVLSHKINNPLTALLGRAQILQLKKGTDPAVCKAADVIEESSRRIADYIRELADVVQEGRGDLLEQHLAEGPEPAAMRRVIR